MLFRSMEDVCLEVGTCGKGDIREPFLEVCFTDGSVTSDFTFVSFEVLTLKDRDERMQASGLPHSYSEEESSSAKCLHIILQDATNRLELQLFYTVYEDCDVITRSYGTKIPACVNAVYQKQVVTQVKRNHTDD